MKLIELKKELEELFSENEMNDIYKILKQVVRKESKKHNILLTIARSHNALSDRIMFNSLANSEVQVEENRLASSLLKLINSIKSSDLDLDSNYSLRGGIMNNILILTRKKEIEDLTNFFQKLNYKNVTVRSEQKNELKDFDIIIFDNRDLPVCYNKKAFEGLSESKRELVLERVTAMQYSIKEPSGLIIHFGNMLHWVNDNREQVQAANSKFSLHARTKEVIDFINTYRV